MNVLKLQVTDVGMNLSDHSPVTLYMRVSLSSHLTDNANIPGSNSFYINWNAFSCDQYRAICADTLKSIVPHSFTCVECIGGCSDHEH